ncbi:MAG: thrombospondin type 3 repeat-containing protein [Deinococcales bacterium]
MNRVRWVAVLLALGGFGIAQLNSVSAFGTYREQVVKQFKFVNAKVSCAFCHNSPGGGDARNAFGQLVESKLSGDISKALFEALAAQQDSDGDGYSDALEVFAGTFPGSKDSSPIVTVAALETAFTKSGGMDQYKP